MKSFSSPDRKSDAGFQIYAVQLAHSSDSRASGCTRYRTAGMDNRVCNTNLYHSRQCSIVLKPGSDGIHYTVIALWRTTAPVIPRLHDRANIEQTSSKCIQNTRANCSTSAQCLLAFIELALRATVISMLIKRAGGLSLEGLYNT